jgi:tetratricopeptide (TPR) repeat protein
MKYFFYLTVTILILLYVNFLYANEINYPDANDYFIPEYEVSLINELKSSIHKLNRLDQVINYLLNFDFDLKTHKNKFYVIEIITMLWKKISLFEATRTSSSNMNTPFLLENPKILQFVNAHENIEEYNDDEILKKLITWIFLKPIGSEKDLCIERRIKLLNKIIENNIEYAPIIYYLLVVIDEYYDRSSLHQLRDRDMIKTIIEKYPQSEFAAHAYIDIACLYAQIGQNKNAIQTLNEMFLKFKNNFFLGTSDLFSSAYSEMVRYYYRDDNKEKARVFIKKINKKIPDIDHFLKYFNE